MTTNELRQEISLAIHQLQINEPARESVLLAALRVFHARHHDSHF